MRIAHVSDIHLSTAPSPRDIGATTEEQAQVLHDVVADIATLSPAPDLITVGGDLYDAGSTPELRLIARRWIGMLRERAPVLIVEGNHEQRRDIDIFDDAETEDGGATVYSHESVPFTSGTVWRPVRGSRAAGCVVGVLPWPRRGDLLAYARAHHVNVTDIHESCAGAMRAVLDGFRLAFAAARARGDVCIILGHLDLAGARLDNGQPVVGKSFLAVSPHDLAATGADVVLLGHIHARQTIGHGATMHGNGIIITDEDMGGRWVETVVGGCPIHYPGALKPTAVGQGDAFGYSVVDVKAGGGPVSITFRPIASVRALVHSVADWRDGKLWYDMHGTHGDSVRLTVRAPAAAREQATAEAEALAEQMRADGARVAVVLDIQRDERASTRGAEVVAARSVREKLEAWWSTGRPPNEAALLDDLARLEEEEAP